MTKVPDSARSLEEDKSGLSAAILDNTKLTGIHKLRITSYNVCYTKLLR